MFDCVSLPNAAELVKFFRKESESMIVEYGRDCYRLKDAADAIERLLAENARLKEQARRGSDYHILKSERDGFKAENAKLKAERNAALTDLRYSASCLTCRWHDSNVCEDCTFKIEWEWRGVNDARTNDIWRHSSASIPPCTMGAESSRRNH